MHVDVDDDFEIDDLGGSCDLSRWPWMDLVAYEWR